MTKKVIFCFIVIIVQASFPNLTLADKWWDKFGEPHYGGTITYPMPQMSPNFDVYHFIGGESDLYYETLFTRNWILDRKIFAKFMAATDPAEVGQWVRAADRYTIEKHWSAVVCPTAGYNAWQPYIRGYSGEALHFGQANIWARLWIDQSLKV